MEEETCPLPENPVLAEMAAALNDAGQWAEIVDRDWRWVYATDAARLSSGLGVRPVPIARGAHYFGPAALSTRMGWPNGAAALEYMQASLAALGPLILADTPGGREKLSELVDPRLADVVDGLAGAEGRTALTFGYVGVSTTGIPRVALWATAVRVHDRAGQLAGTAIIAKPAVGMDILGAMAGGTHPRHLASMQHVARAARRPAAVLFADLEASSQLARRLSTANYFALGRRMTRAADHCVVDAGGLVGRHVGDGVVAFFLAETAGSESAAARSCIEATRNLREAMIAVARRSELTSEDLIMRFGLHWGATLYVGQIATSGRTEVTALGDEVNEGARIEACATGGRTLASKELLERLNTEDAVALDLDPDHITYTPLTDLPTATEKARRDAPAIVVCEV